MSDVQVVEALVARGRAAMAEIADADQARIDDAVTAIAWSLYNPDTARRLAEQAVADTGLGNVEDKIIKNQRKTFGALRDLLRVRTVGVIEDDPERGLVKIAKPVGVVGAITPSTNPSATPVNKAMMAVKGGNAIILAPSPAGWSTTSATADVMRAELARIGLPEDLVQVLPAPVTRSLTQALMEAVDLVVATGSQANVRGAYRSGTPAIGVGAGNVPVIVDETADLAAAAERIRASKIFDNATSCSSENAVIVVDEVYEAAIAALQHEGAYRTTLEERERIAERLWPDGKLNREVLAKDADVFAGVFDLAAGAEGARFFLVEEPEFDPASRFADEKLSLVLTVYRARNFDDAMNIVEGVLNVQGRGHSCGIHTTKPERARALAERTDVVRVLVNQAHTFGNGGSFDNALNFTLSMGCGTWGGNSISENLNYRNFINVTHLVSTVAEDKPTEAELFGSYLARYGDEAK